MSLTRFTPRSMITSAVSRAAAWAEASNEGSCRNALWSSLAMADERRQRDEIDAFLEDYSREFRARRAEADRGITRVAG